MSNKLNESVCENLHFDTISSVGMSEKASTCKCASYTHQYVSIRQHTSACVSIRQHTLLYMRIIYTSEYLFGVPVLYKNLSTLTC